MRVLQLSGGKDSLAVLLLLKHELSSILVLWADSGDSFPETREQMEVIRGMCPNFEIVRGNQPQVIAEFGYPVDVLPVANHCKMQEDLQVSRPKLQDFLSCCGRSLLNPMHERSLALGATVIIRGQKLADKKKSSIRSGDVVDGITYVFPIEDWSDARVINFVRESGMLPPHYDVANTSLDCMHCTAYLADNQWKLPYLREKYPEVAADVYDRLKVIKREVDNDMQYLNNLMLEEVS